MHYMVKLHGDIYIYYMVMNGILLMADDDKQTVYTELDGYMVNGGLLTTYDRRLQTDY
jgi:hypothetical protein